MLWGVLTCKLTYNPKNSDKQSYDNGFGNIAAFYPIAMAAQTSIFFQSE